MKRNIRISGTIIGTQAPVFLISEAGVNHNGDGKAFERIIKILEELKIEKRLLIKKLTHQI